MAVLWVIDAAGWAAVPLDANLVGLDRAHPRAIAGGETGPRATDASLPTPLLVRCGEDAAGSWALVARSDTPVRVNGLPVASGLRLLRDRDEIRVEGIGRWYLSLESQAAIEPAPATDPGLRCPRCTLAIDPDSPAVRCPDCGVWYHQSEADERPCWTYTSGCAICSYPTALDAGLRWSPEGL